MGIVQDIATRGRLRALCDHATCTFGADAGPYKEALEGNSYVLTANLDNLAEAGWLFKDGELLCPGHAIQAQKEETATLVHEVTIRMRNRVRRASTSIQRAQEEITRLITNLDTGTDTDNIHKTIRMEINLTETHLRVARREYDRLENVTFCAHPKAWEAMNQNSIVSRLHNMAGIQRAIVEGITDNEKGEQS